MNIEIDELRREFKNEIRDLEDKVFYQILMSVFVGFLLSATMHIKSKKEKVMEADKLICRPKEN